MAGGGGGRHFRPHQKKYSGCGALRIAYVRLPYSRHLFWGSLTPPLGTALMQPPEERSCLYGGGNGAAPIRRKFLAIGANANLRLLTMIDAPIKQVNRIIYSFEL